LARVPHRTGRRIAPRGPTAESARQFVGFSAKSSTGGAGLARRGNPGMVKRLSRLGGCAFLPGAPDTGCSPSVLGCSLGAVFLISALASPACAEIGRAHV